ncbi:hypothetical protein LCGC14_2041870 [marine sediment metagenome]|uniref:Uncharacterized protein n=1 Tax=marine sediment metagenome TaxID=412755 RepID=A0A0F9HNQ3_9ZZZZ
MKKTTRIVIETKNFRFGYEKIVEKPDRKPKPLAHNPRLLKKNNIDTYM